MSTINNLIHELTIFYVKTNYENYLEMNNLKIITEDEIPKVIDELYNVDKKEHMKLLVFEIQIICMFLKILFQKYHLLLHQSVKNKLGQEKN